MPVVRPLLVGQVDCDAGGSVNKALAAAFARRVVLHLWGTCRESVVVDRPGVTLSGSLSGTAVIDPPDEDGIPIGPAVYALGAHELTLEELTLRGGTDGLEAHASRKMQLTRVSAIENDFCGESCWPSGVYLNASEATIADSDLSSNFGPLWVEQHSTAIVTDTVMQNNTDGPFSAGNSYLSMRRCSLQGNELGPQAFYYSTTIVADSSVGAPGSPEWSAAWLTGSLLLSGTEIHGDVSVSKDSFLQLGGSASLDGTIMVTQSSYAEIGRSVSMTGSIYVIKFSDAYIGTAQPVVGSVFCSDRSRAVCREWPTGGMDGCE
jgi:hypothetical protein